MQQTEKYKFNIIETSDTFSPDALNANARAAETALAALASADAALAAADAALANTDAALAKADTTNKAALEQSITSTKTALEQSIASTKTALEQTITNTKTALEKTITANKTTADTAISSLNADVHPGAVGQLTRIVTGTYVGQCINGNNSPSTLSFNFKPMLLFINSSYDTCSLIMMRPGTYSYYGFNTPCTVTWSEKSVTWSNYYPQDQCNNKGVTYNYIAIGVPV